LEYFEKHFYISKYFETFWNTLKYIEKYMKYL
jgi:hypothetical protein